MGNAVNFSGAGLPRGNASMLGKIANVYSKIAGSDDYARSENSLRLIQVAVVTLSAAATGFVNSFAHRERIGDGLAVVLAVLVTGFVEKFYFTLRHGLTTVFKAGKQRLYASICYRAIQATMVLNAAVLCAWIVGLEVPPALLLWNHWSIAAHFGLALIGVSAVRDSDAVIANRMLELKAETARQDVVTIRKASAIGSGLVLAAARVRGLLDACGLAWRLFRSRSDFGRDYLSQIDRIAVEQFAHIDHLELLPGPGSAPIRRPGFVNQTPQDAAPKAPRGWI